MGLVSARNWQKFLKALRTENPLQVIINVFKKISRTVFKSYKRNTISFQGSKPVILWVLPNLPEKDKSSGERRLHHLFELISPYIDIYIYTEGVRNTKIPSQVNLIPEWSLKKLKKNIPSFQFIVFSWFTTFENLKKVKSLYPHSKFIIDSVDLHWIREERALGILKGLLAKDVNETKRRELSAYKDVDMVWTVTETDKKILLSHIPTLKVHVISNIHPLINSLFKPRIGKKILFVGGFNHYPNLTAALHLANVIFPEILLTYPDAQLVIAGSNPPQEIIELSKNDHIFVTGYLTDEELFKLYEEVTVTIVPLFTGSGIKGKICEAIAYRVPVITNEIGNEGIDLIHEQEALIVPNHQMAKTAIRLLSGDYDIKRMVANAQLKLSSIVSPEVVQKALFNVFLPQINICIVTHNRLGLLKDCIESVLENTNYPRFKVMVYSNACTDGSIEYLKKISHSDRRIIAIYSKTNEVFVKPNNYMMRASSPHDVVLLNNDTTVTKGWLLSLFAAAYSSPYYGIAGSKLLYPDGTLQEFGAELNLSTGLGFNRGKGEINHKPYESIQETGYVSGCAMYIKRSTINAIGFLDEQFHPCYYEDSDYCYTAKKHGLKTVVTPFSVVYHHEGATSGGDSKKYQSINREKFVAKHSLKK